MCSAHVGSMVGSSILGYRPADPGDQDTGGGGVPRQV